MPQALHRRPIQLTAVPVKVKVTVAPVTSELPALPPLKAATSAPRRTQAPVGLALMAGLSSSKRVSVPPVGGAPAWKVTALSVLVDAVFVFPAASCATPAPMVAITVPSVMPLTATV